ncbi:MAG: hypothetical protein KatS3mg051_2138 [Anaerolineae bacterium]|nr:MAG: hypothetical protein KatS3mg051_2138 [Anaerolineae bacterium]
MAVAARYTKIWVDEFDFSGDSMSAVTSLQSPTVDATTFQQSGKVWQVIGPEGSISQSGYIMALGTDEMEEELYARLGSSGTHYVAALYGTTTTGCPAYVVPGTSVRNLQIQAPIDGILTINAEWGIGNRRQTWQARF